MHYRRQLAQLWIVNALSAVPVAAQEVQAVCTPTRLSLPLAATSKGLSGAYQLRIVGTGGEAVGQMVTGTLKLWAPPDSFQTIRWSGDTLNPYLTMPLIGTADIDFTRLGAMDNGGWSSADPGAPGIAVWELQAGYPGRQPFTDITMRIGAYGNRRGIVQHDGAYSALLVDKIDSTGFRGRWLARMGYSSYKADGFFCATRR